MPLSLFTQAAGIPRVALERWERVAYLAIVAGATASWAQKIWTGYSTSGLFHWIGADYRIYFAQAVALRLGDFGAIYDREALKAYHQDLAVYTSEPIQSLQSGHVLYPPLFAWLFVPFTLPPPPVGFALWTSLNLLAALYLAWRVADLFPKQERLWVALLLLTSFPLIQTLVLGQPVILLACAVGECYRSLRAGRELRAGLWLSCLLFKPQYAILLGTILVWKRRWAAVAGVGLGAVAIGLGSLLVVGAPALLGYPAALTEESEFHGTLTPSFPGEMINWRSLVLFFLPGIADTPGILLTLLLGAATVLGLVLAWRGPWAPRERLFPAKVAVALVATLLASYHSHLHGAVLLAMPLAAVLAEARPSSVTRLTIVAGLVLPTLMLVRTALSPDTPPIPPLFAVVLVICFAILLIEVWLPDRPEVESGSRAMG